MELQHRRDIEISFWRDSTVERPGADDIENQLDKSADAFIFREALRPFESIINRSKSAVELGAGQGWGSCVLKRVFPHLKVTATDISEYAVESKGRWEHIYGTQLDGAVACTSDHLPFENETIDLLFCFAAAHHFVTHEETLQELARVLRPGGTILYLYEPTTPKAFYRMAVDRVNRKRPEVPEDVLIPSRLKRAASDAGLEYRLHFWPATFKRGKLASLYYSLLSVCKPLCYLLPCTAHFEFHKPPA